MLSAVKAKGDRPWPSLLCARRNTRVTDDDGRRKGGKRQVDLGSATSDLSEDADPED